MYPNSPAFTAIASAQFVALDDASKRNLINDALCDWQVDGFWSQLDILRRHGLVFHTSRGGAGKTLLVSLAARYLGKDLVVFANKSSFDSWERDAPRVGVKINAMITYQKLRGSGRCDNVYIRRNDDDSYSHKDGLVSLLSSQPLVVFDEIHYARNEDTFLYKALLAISRLLKSTGCHLAAISATPSYLEKDAKSYIKLFRLVDDGEWIGYDKTNHVYVPLALRSYIDLCRTMDAAATAKALSRTLNVNNLDAIVFDLFIGVTIPHINVKVEPQGLPHINRLHIFCELEPSTLAMVQEAERVRNRKTAIGLNKPVATDRTGILYSANNEYDETVEIIIAEHAMYPDTLEIVRENPDAKLLYILHYRESMRRLEERLSQHYPSKVKVMHGDTDAADRKAITKAYQCDSDDCKFLITSKDVGGTSYSLDDPIGNRKRFVFKRSDRSADKNAQVDWRTSRATSKSETDIRDYYVGGVKLELDRFNNNKKKHINVAKYQGTSIN